MASRTLRLALDRLSGDWQLRYEHPVVLVETFVDPKYYCGTTYTVSGWQELGRTEGHGRVRRDSYTEHGKPKRLFARELYRGARRSLAAETLKPSLAAVEGKVPPRPTQSSEEIRSIIGNFKNLPDYRSRIGSYPLWSLLAIVFMAHLGGASRGQKDLEKFAAGLSNAQRRALGIQRLSNSLCLHWISKQTCSHHKTTTYFLSAMNACHHRYAFRSLFAAHPAFSTAS